MFTPLPPTPPVSVCVRQTQERLLNFRGSGEMNAVAWDVAQGKGACLWPELSPRITTLTQPGVFSVSRNVIAYPFSFSMSLSVLPLVKVPQ